MTADENDKLTAHRIQMAATGGVPMTAEEILAGATQAGVPRPDFLRDDEEDGTVETVGGQR